MAGNISVGGAPSQNNDYMKNPITGAGFDSQQPRRAIHGLGAVGQEIASMKSLTAVPDLRVSLFPLFFDNYFLGQKEERKRGQNKKGAGGAEVARVLQPIRQSRSRCSFQRQRRKCSVESQTFLASQRGHFYY